MTFLASSRTSQSESASIAGIRRTALLLLMPILLVLICYAQTIPLPYFWDDVPHFVTMSGRSYLDIWTNSIRHAYYRPLALSLYKFMFDALPFGATALPHIWLLSLHGLNSFLVGRLCRWLVKKHGLSSRGLDVAEIAGSLAYALLPFAALPIIHFAAAMHPLATGFTLIGVLAALKFYESRQRRWYAIAALAALLAPYNHEAGVMAGSVMALTWLIYAGWGDLRRNLWIVSLPVISAAFFGVWLMVPKTYTGGFHLGAADEILAKVTFFFQGLTYPLQPLATPLIYRWQWWDVGTILLIGGLALLLAGYALYEQRLWRPFVLSVGWLALTMLPTVAALQFGYIVTSPRLLYFPAIGGVILWSAVLAACLTNHKRRWVSWAMAVFWLLGVMGVPLTYIRREVRLHVFALSPLQQLAHIARAYPDAQHLVVNTINWVAYKTLVYPLGHDGVTVSASYVRPAHLVMINSGVAPQGDFVTFIDLRPTFEQYYLSTLGETESWNMELFTHHIAHYDHVWLTTYSESSTSVLPVGHVYVDPHSNPVPERYLANFEGQVYLLQATYEVQDQALLITLDWQLAAPDLRADATVFANVLDCAGNVLGPESGPPLGRMLALASLPVGAQVHDIRHVPLVALSADNCYSVEVGFFHPEGTRMNVYAPDGTEFVNQLFPLRR